MLKAIRYVPSFGAMPIVGLHHAIHATHEWVSDRVAHVDYSDEFFFRPTEMVGSWDCRRITARRVGCHYEFTLWAEGSVAYVERGRLVVTPTGVRSRSSERPALRSEPARGWWKR